MRQSMNNFKGFNSGTLLYGDSGIGKSGIMTYLTTWAHDNNWIVMNIPHAKRLVSDGYKVDRMENGLYILPELS